VMSVTLSFVVFPRSCAWSNAYSNDLAFEASASPYARPARATASAPVWSPRRVSARSGYPIDRPRSEGLALSPSPARYPHTFRSST
jgi:hypothetical protein